MAEFLAEYDQKVVIDGVNYMIGANTGGGGVFEFWSFEDKRGDKILWVKEVFGKGETSTFINVDKKRYVDGMGEKKNLVKLMDLNLRREV